MSGILTIKTALLGGSFDPVHNGHIEAAVRTGKKLNFDKVVLVPNYQNPLKGDGPQAPPEKRFEMLKLATGQLEGIEVSSLEIEKKSASYTVETLRLWKARNKRNSLWLVVGRDLFAGINKWKQFREIFEISNVAVISRAGSNTHIKSEPPFEIRENFLYDEEADGMVCFKHKGGLKLFFVKIDAPDISSTEIRNRIKNGEAFEHLVPPAVADFIKREKLYLRELPK